jgi:hypothetical protein
VPTISVINSTVTRSNTTSTWKNACTAAGCPGRLRHDFRRTAVRNFVRVGIPERVAMTLPDIGHAPVFERYNIVSEGDLAAAAQRPDQNATGTIAGTMDTFGRRLAERGAAK